MPAKDQLTDQDPLFTGVSPENPAGSNLRYTALYDEITACRMADDPSVSRGVWEHKLKKADYKKAADLLYTALATKSKDLQLAAWLVEAWTVLYGSEGLVQGFAMLDRFIETFWPSMYPKLDDPSDPSGRLAPLQWLNQKLPLKIKTCLVILPPSKGYDAPLTLDDLLRAQTLEKQIQQSQDPQAARKKLQKFHGVTSDGSRLLFLESLTERLAASKDGPKGAPSPLLVLSEHLATTTTYIEKIEAFLKQSLPDFPFAFSGIKKTFHALTSFLQPYLPFSAREANAPQEPLDTEPPPLAVDPSLNEIDGSSMSTSTEPTKKKKVSPANDMPTPSPSDDALSPSTTALARRQAYEQLASIANLLMQLEPHSPAPYLIRKAIRWGNMSLEELLEEIMAEGGDLGHYMRWLGMGKSKQLTQDDPTD